jgi:hypothetical protein
VEALRAAQVAVDALAAVDPAELDPAALGVLIKEVDRLVDRLTGLSHRAVAAQGRTAGWRVDGARSHKQWLAEHCRLSPGQAAARARTAKQLAQLPETAEALTAGRIGTGAARIAAQAVRDLPPDAAAGLDRLVAATAGTDGTDGTDGQDGTACGTGRGAGGAGVQDGGAGSAGGSGMEPGRLRRALQEYAHRVAPEGLEQRQRRGWANRRLTLSSIPDGAVVDGRLDLVGAETVQTALSALSAPKGPDDDRTPEQRRADALVLLARQALDSGGLPMVGGVRPHVTVVVPLETLDTRTTTDPADPADADSGDPPDADSGDPAGAGEAGAPGGVAGVPDVRSAGGSGPAVLDRMGVVCGETARLLACDAGITRVITAGGSQPVAVGRETRVVSPAQRRALAVRDRGCVGCAAPAAWCEAHHVIHWAHGGPTDLDNLVLVCWNCHRSIHENGRQPVRGPDGRWTLHPPGGTRDTTRSHPSGKRHARHGGVPPAVA